MGFDREVLLPLSIAVGAVTGGLLGAWAGTGAGIIVFWAIFLPVVYLAGIKKWGSR